MKSWFKWIPVLIALGACAAPQPQPQPNPTLVLTPTQAARTEQVTATLSGLSATGAQVFIGNLAVPVQSTSAAAVVFTLPSTLPGGPQTIRVVAGDQSVSQEFKVLGDVSRNEVAVMVKAGVSEASFQARLASLNMGLTLLNFRPLAGPGPCASAIARVSVPATQSIGLVLDRLNQPDQADVVLLADPQSLWDLDAVDHLSAVGVPAAQNRGRTGAGVTIAVLDTGVSNHSLLANNLLPGYDFVSEDNQPADLFDDPATTASLDGHGTPVAILAAGQRLGAAPAAQVLPIRIGDENGEILASNAIRGICYALERVDNKKLVLNLSFGGDTPVEGLKLVLDYALKQGVLVAAAAGNQGAGGPTHYPAAFDLPGLVAVGALNLVGKAWTPASFSTTGNYVDIAAPGQGITSGSASGTNGLYDGTSFATPLVAGALALWREANPAATAAQIEQSLKTNARALAGAIPTEVGSGMLDLTTKP